MQMRVERIDVQPLGAMMQNDIISIIGQGRMGVDISDSSIRSGQDRVGWLAVFVALQTADVQSFMQLRPVAAHAAEGSGRPWLSNRSDEKFFFAIFFKKRVVRCRQQKGLSTERKTT